MDLRFVTPDLRQLDLVTTELIVVPVATDERPPQGTAGLLDYRLGGELSELIQAGTITGELGQFQLVRGRPRLTFERVLVVGMGSSAEFNPQVYGALISRMLTEIERLAARRAVVELPGRHGELVPPELAAEVLLDLSRDSNFFDTWTLIETTSGSRAIQSILRRDQRKWGGWR